jgi:hypothetical protein
METDILLFGESEIMIKTLSEVPLDNVGNKVWKRQHEYVNKLNQQAQINAQMEKSDYISEHFTR